MATDPFEELDARIALAHASPPGDRTTHRLTSEHGAAATVRFARGETAPPGMTRLGYESWRRELAPRLDPAQLDRIHTLAEQHDLTILTPDDPVWRRSGLDALGERAPLALWAQGDTDLLSWELARRVAITGNRAETARGVDANGRMVESLIADDEHAIVSSGKYGTETTALRTAVLGGGRGIAVLPGGLDRHYPTGNEIMLRHLGRYHLIVSETSPGTPPTRHRHEQVYRLMAALSGATAVIEATLRNQTLNIADEAIALGRPVGTIPSLELTGHGPSELIRTGRAKPVRTGDDVRALIRDGISHPPSQQADPPPADRSRPLADPSRFGTSTSRRDDPGLTR